MTKERLDKLIDVKEKEQDNKDLPFLQSLRNNLEKWGKLTEKQSKAFERIEYLSSPEGIAAVQKWRQEYGQDHKEKALICARYYLANPPYFNDLAQKIVSTSDFVPTENQYRAMCDNNYTKRVLAEFERPPIYEKSAIVQIRHAQSLPYHLHEIRGQPCVVIANNTGTIVTHATGAKIYKILPFGQTKMFECQERYLKSFKTPKKGKKEKEHE